AAAKSEAPARTKNTAGKGLKYAERLELEAIEPKIEAADADVTSLEAALADPETYSGDPGRARTVAATLETARELSASLTDRWAELEAKR
ncbi:MAG: ABC transporter ATP-binding protein, partial [Nannocystaceae bacterium]|nr:ABC transporter ATP-binding protein [Nannocystaceae bacterium]